MLNIIIENGLVQSIESDDPALQGSEVNVIDLNTEGWDDLDVTQAVDRGCKLLVGVVTHAVTAITITIPAAGG